MNSMRCLILVLISHSLGGLCRGDSATPTLWSLKPVVVREPPSRPESSWNANPIDAFIFTRLRQEGLTPGEPAGRRALIRRLTFGLTGLPPTPAEVTDYLNDPSTNALSKVVERLLASRHYGEHWGRHWLDLVRYADTAGDAADFPVPEAYKYRNYIIKAFNRDKPYDEFIREQIAGDLLPYQDDEERWEQIVATGYLAVSRRIGVSPHSLRHITLEDTINNLGKTFLGLTVGCARCHDHKFDPVPTTDYYALYGILDSSVFPHPGAEHKPYREDFVYRVGKKQSDAVLKPYRERLAAWNRKERKQFDLYRSFQREKVTDPNLTRQSTWQELQRIRARQAEVARSFPDLEIAYAIQEGDPHDVTLMPGGDPKAKGPSVPRGFLQVLGGQTLPEGHRGSGRKELADWIADPSNPLTARVMVNRIWHYHFGRGLVTSTSDFGERGQRPTHPALLDFLADYFVKHGWSIKAMHRLILSSRTYQLSSRSLPGNALIDPDNQWLWRANRRRLDAEQIRDSLLLFSGELDVTPGGRHPFPHHLTYFYRQHEPFQEKYASFKRSVYLMQQRIQKNVDLDLFDCPDGNLHVGERNVTTTPLQALYLMNSAFIHERTQAMATRILQAANDRDGRVNWAYAHLLGRRPTSQDLDRAETYLSETISRLPPGDVGGKEKAAWAGYLRAMFSSNEFMYVD